MGGFLYNRVRGVGSCDVVTERHSKSIGVEHTFSENISDLINISLAFDDVFKELWRRFEKQDKRSSTLQFKLKFKNFKTVTRRCSLHSTIHSYNNLFTAIP